MGYFRFHKVLRLLPGLRLNLSKSGPSVSLGVTGARVNIGPEGVRTTVGIPGSGLSHVTQHPWKAAESTREEPGAPLVEPAAEPYVPGVAEAAVSGPRTPEPEAQPAPRETGDDPGPGPANPHLYAFGQKWFPILARTRTNERLPEWLIEAERDYRVGNIDRYGYELRRQVILEEMAARGRGVRPRSMTRAEEQAMQREMMAASAAEMASRP